MENFRRMWHADRECLLRRTQIQSNYGLEHGLFDETSLPPIESSFPDFDF